MANICSFDLKAISPNKQDLLDLITIFTQEYDYDTPLPIQPPHFYKVGDFVHGEISKNHDYFMFTASGWCNWSLYAAWDQNGYHKIFRERGTFEDKSTCIQDFAKAHPEIQIEAFSSEPGCEYSEHYLIQNGKVMFECEEYQETYLETVEDVLEYIQTDSPEDYLDEFWVTLYPDWFIDVGKVDYQELVPQFTI